MAIAPTVALLDVNETLEVSAPPQLLPTPGSRPPCETAWSGSRRWALEARTRAVPARCRAMGVEEAQAMLIAAHPWDVHGAKRAGVLAGWVDRHGQPYPEVFAPPDVSAADLPALARALAG